MMLVATLDAVPGVRDRGRGRPRRRPDKLHAEKGYDHRRCRRECRVRGIRPWIARRGVKSSAHLGRHRWVVERRFAWLARLRRLSIRHERRAGLHLPFTTLACAAICLRQTRRFVPGSKGLVQDGTVAASRPAAAYPCHCDGDPCNKVVERWTYR